MQIALTIIIGYILLTNLIGILAAKNVKSSPDFFNR